MIIASVMNFDLGIEYIVYDGPGLLADTSKNQRIIQCSTFQCIIHLLTYKNNHSHTDFKYYTKALPSLKSVTISQEQILSVNLPNINCLETVCVISIHTSYGYHINVTINKLIGTGLYDQACLYGGLVASEQLIDDYRQSRTECKNYHATEQARSFYSHKSSLVIILYWYKMYNTFNTTVDISGTTCEPVHIDICHFHDVCKEDNSSSCLLYLNFVTQYSSINISISIRATHNTMFEEYGNTVLIVTPMQNKCLVLALLKNETIRNIEICEISMNLIKSEMIAIRSSWHDGYLIEWATREVCSSQLYHLNTSDVFTIKSNWFENVTLSGEC